jgi:apolipoprotein N-acyltransferase
MENQNKINWIFVFYGVLFGMATSLILSLITGLQLIYSFLFMIVPTLYFVNKLETEEKHGNNKNI